MSGMPWMYDDGGRAAAGFKGSAGDCITRAIAIATGLPYRQVYGDLQNEIGHWRTTSQARAARRLSSNTPRDGVPWPVCKSYIEGVLGWVWTPTMQIGVGTTVHLRSGELPDGTLLVKVSRHLTAVIDGVIHDTYNPDREGTRAVYGHWRAP
jgi:hypothetical protein